MKKTLLKILPICAVFALVSCGNQTPATSEKPSETPATSESVPATSETPSSSETPATSESTSTSEEEITPAHTAIIYLHDIPNLTAGANLAEDKTPEQKAPLINHFNDGVPGLLSDYSVTEGTSVNINEDDTRASATEKHAYITLGSKKKTGELTLTFTKAIKEITINARAYSKAYDKTVDNVTTDAFSMDKNCAINLNVAGTQVATTECPSVDNAVPEFVNLTHTFETPVTEFSISNAAKAARVYINSLTLEF